MAYLKYNIDEFAIGEELEVENKNDHKKYKMFISEEFAETTYKFYENIKGLLDVKIYDYCILNDQKVISEYSKDEPNKYRTYSMVMYRKLKSEEFNKSNFNKIFIFELYFNLLMLRYKHDINIEYDDMTIKLLPYNKRTKYVISNSVFITPIMKYRIVFDHESYILNEEMDYSIDFQFYKNINVIKHKNIMSIKWNSYLEEDDEIIKYLSLIGEDVSAIDVLLGMGKLLIGENTDEIKVNLKNIRELGNEIKDFDFTKKVPPIKAYQDKNFCYPRFIATGRPISYMIEMCKKVINIKDLVKDNLYLPVMRYQNLYYQEKQKGNYKGTFYYIEPESTVLLNLGKCCVFATKVEAYCVFRQYLNSIFDRLKDELESLSICMDMWKNVKNKFKLTTLQVYEIMKDFYTHPLYNEKDVKKILDTTVLFPTDKSRYWKMNKLKI